MRERRPDLRTLIKEQKLRSYTTFLSSFKEREDGVETLHGELNQLNSICESICRTTYGRVNRASSMNLTDEIVKLEGEHRELELSEKGFVSSLSHSAPFSSTLKRLEDAARN
jgi:hypothetical protein